MKLALNFPPGKFVRLLFYFSLGFLAVSLAVNFWDLYGKADDYWFLTHNFDFDEKNNIPHAFKSVLLVFCACAIFLNARAESQAGGKYIRHWWILGWIFLAMSVDEEVQIHQKTVSLFIAWAMGVDVDTAPDAKLFWVVPYLIFTAIFCIAYLGFWWRLPPRVRNLFAYAGVIYVGGAAIVEEIAHHFAKHYGDTNVTYLFLTNGSEWMQMVGSILFIHALLIFLTRNPGPTAIQFEMGDQSATG